jgi:transcription antitermination protein NusB
MASRRKARIYAMQALFSWDVSGQPLEELLEFEWLDTRPDLDETLAFSRLLIRGTIEELKDVDAAIQNHLEHWKIERLAKVDLAILRLSAYALLYQRDIPASVTIDEAVELARDYGSDESYRFVNGVLDAIRKDSRE